MEAHILTVYYNLYDQLGSYFVAWFEKKPTASELVEAVKASEASVVLSTEDALELVYDAEGYDNKGIKPNQTTFFSLDVVESANSKTKVMI